MDEGTRYLYDIIRAYFDGPNDGPAMDLAQSLLEQPPQAAQNEDQQPLPPQHAFQEPPLQSPQQPLPPQHDIQQPLLQPPPQPLQYSSLHQPPPQSLYQDLHQLQLQIQPLYQNVYQFSNPQKSHDHQSNPIKPLFEAVVGHLSQEPICQQDLLPQLSVGTATVPRFIGNCSQAGSNTTRGSKGKRARLAPSPPLSDGAARSEEVAKCDEAPTPFQSYQKRLRRAIEVEEAKAHSLSSVNELVHNGRARTLPDPFDLPDPSEEVQVRVKSAAIDDEGIPLCFRRADYVVGLYNYNADVANCTVHDITFVLKRTGQTIPIDAVAGHLKLQHRDVLVCYPTKSW